MKSVTLPTVHQYHPFLGSNQWTDRLVVGKSREPPPNEPQPWPSDATESKPLHGATAYANGHPLRNSSPDRRLTALSDHQFGTPFTAEELTKAVTDTGLRPTVLAS